jgi:hypothetical protein
MEDDVFRKMAEANIHPELMLAPICCGFGSGRGVPTVLAYKMSTVIFKYFCNAAS